MKLYVEVDGKIIGEFDIFKESLGDFLKRKKIGNKFEISRESSILSLKTLPNGDSQLGLDL